MVITLFLILKTGTQNWTPYILDTAKLLATFFSKMLYFSQKDKKKASDATTAEKIKLPHSYSMTAPMPI